MRVGGGSSVWADQNVIRRLFLQPVGANIKFRLINLSRSIGVKGEIS